MTPTTTGMGWKQENYSDRVKLYDISSANGRTDIFYIMGKALLVLAKFRSCIIIIFLSFIDRYHGRTAYRFRFEIVNKREEDAYG